ncbi:hypothetical protein D0T84_14140 [Dysgonomonas sp. 521]|uniref:hypothetical protein n=1 Tax=Dysgonomonas sp. 521 TaxID=2302932 RepID=UPI0013D4F72E|nr:hypothetical protein [Dysgonomonas sp. 521]NDV96044.1 hypothetical protein [Dysgonomonas sp. 521]
MKRKSYNLLFRFFSFLADKTNGAPLFVKYKLLLGTLIIGVAGTSCSNKSKVTCYDMSLPPDEDSMQITCYEPTVPFDTLNEPTVPEEMITYYDIAAPTETIPEKNKED